MKLLLPILLVVIGVGGGIGAGMFLRPPPAEMSCDAASDPECETAMDPGYAAAEMAEEEEPSNEFVKLNNQFVVPVIDGQRVSALVVMSLSVEVKPGEVETVYAREPKLRDAFLQVMFDHANVGGFNGAFTNSNTLDVLRRSLLEASYHAIGALVTDVLITEIARQDV